MDPVIASRDDTHGDEVFSFSPLPPKIDYICLTHSHQDHVNIETLLQLRYKIDPILVPKNNGGSIADPSLKLMLIGMACVGAPYTWMYGALHTKRVSKKVKDSRRLNGCDVALAFGMAEIFKPKAVYVYALGLEPWYNYMMGLEYEDDPVQIVESNKMLVSCKTIGLHCEKRFGTKLIEYS
jgi:hypothetical protein